MSKLKNRVCIVTGGGGSLGAAAARLFLDNGASVMLVDRDVEGLHRAASGLPLERVDVMAADVKDPAAVADYVKRALSRFGRIDVLFSNAGNFGTVQPIAQYPDDVFEDVMAVHVKGAYLAAKHVSPHMRQGGSIIITSSVAGVRGDA